MRVLTYVHDQQALHRITQLMASKGIATHAVSASRLRGPTKWALFVCLNSQVDDAIQLLCNENHEVSSPIDVEAFNRNAKIRNLRHIAYWSTWLLLAVGAAFAIVVWAAWHFRALA